MRILVFLLETVFFLLIAAALLRSWMNGLRINMRAQPGGFVMALTDWLVKPLRRSLPKALTQSSIDWASLLAAALLALLHAVLLWWLLGMLPGTEFWLQSGLPAIWPLLLPVFALKILIKVTLQTLFLLVLGYAVVSWVQPGSPAYNLLGRLSEPLLAPFRRIIPAIGGVDLSALALLVLLQIGMMLLT
ncbi:membrane protein [Polaromonas sp.]|nr:membrane protein [Polaromonas sp.]